MSFVIVQREQGSVVHHETLTIPYADERLDGSQRHERLGPLVSEVVFARYYTFEKVHRKLENTSRILVKIRSRIQESPFYLSIILSIYQSDFHQSPMFRRSTRSKLASVCSCARQ